MNLVKDLYGLSKKVLTKGDIGIEIEEEGRRLPDYVEGWNVVHDGSLNEFGREYVLSSPVKIGDVDKALGNLKSAHLACKSEVYDTIRAGVHIHVNCQDLTMTQLHNFIITYLILEDLLVSYCGPSREGNLFCLRLKDAKALSRYIIHHLRRKDGFYHDEDIRYASINLTSLSKYGSLEFRAMRSTDDYSVISNWAHMLYNIKQFSRQFRDPKHIIESFSEGEYDIFARNALGDELYAELGKTPQEVQQMLKGCMRRSQGIAYATDWKLYEEHFQGYGRFGKEETPLEVAVNGWAAARVEVPAEVEARGRPRVRARGRAEGPVRAFEARVEAAVMDRIRDEANILAEDEAQDLGPRPVPLPAELLNIILDGQAQQEPLRPLFEIPMEEPEEDE